MVLCSRDLPGAQRRKELEGMTCGKAYAAPDTTAFLGQALRGQQGHQGPWPMWQAEQSQAVAKASLDLSHPLGLSYHCLRPLVTTCMRVSGVGDSVLMVRSPRAVMTDNGKVPGGSSRWVCPPIRCHSGFSPVLSVVLAWPQSLAGHITETDFRDQEILIKSHLEMTLLFSPKVDDHFLRRLLPTVSF